MVLAAGFGTRLKPLTDELPKPLLPLGDRSLLDHALWALRDCAVSGDVLVNVHHLASRFEAHKAEFCRGVELIHEPRIRGTAGGIAGAREYTDESGLVVLNADVVLDRVPPEFMALTSAGALVLALRPAGELAGNVGVSAAGQVVRLRGQHFGPEAWSGDYVGLCALSSTTLRELPDQGCLIGDYALPALRQGRVVRAVPYLGRCDFPGDDLNGFLAGNWTWLERRGQSIFRGPGSQISSETELQQVVLSGGVCVLGAGRVERVVACPGARFNAPLENACVLPSGRVVQLGPRL